ncbi:hypothetical protein JCM11491_002161 [Sporobolomyces phaffii]
MTLGTDSAMVDDDPWLEDDSAAPSTSRQISGQEWDKLSSRYSDAGYRDGITAGKNANLQAGFDQGFALAAPYARELGALRGIAASVLALLTTASGAKHSGTVLAALDDASSPATTTKDALVAELRDVVNALGKLDATRVLPVDAEAEEHAKSHEDEGVSQQMRDRKEMREMEELLSGVGGRPAPPSGVDECRARLARVLAVFGMEDVLPPPRS